MNERLSHALSTGLDQSAVAALGWAGRKHPLGAAMLRASLSGEEQDEQLATAVAAAYCERMAKRWDIGKGAGFWKRFAATAVRHWLNPACPACHGLRYETIPGTPTLSDRPCPQCDGTGIAKYPKIAGESLAKRPWRDRVNEVVTYLETQQQIASTAVRKALT